MPYDPRTGRMITDEQAERLAEEAGRPAPPPRPEEQPGLTERLGDAAHTAVSTALDIAHRIQAVTFGQEALSRRPIEQFTGWDAPDIMELGTRINLGMTPLAWPQEARSIPMEYPGLMVRPFAAAISPTLEALRRYRMGEEQETLGWYAQQAARELFRGPQNEGPVSKVLAPFGDWTPGGALLRQFAPELREAPETDRFRAGYELVTGQREGAARGWAGAAGLVAGEAGELLPMLPLLLISRGPATTRGMQRVGAQAATRTGSYLFETARSAANRGADVATVEGLVKASQEAPGVLRSLSDRWFGQRRTLAGNIRESMREGRGTALDRLMKDFVEGEARLTREAEAALVGRGVSETAAKAAARSFASEVIWGAEEGWRLAGVRLGRRPGETVVSRLRRRAETTAGRDPAGLRTIAELERPAETFPLSQLNEPVRSRAVQNAEFYLRQRSSRASATSEAAASSVLDTMNAGAEAAAKVRAEAVMRERLSGAVRRLRMNEEARATAEGQAPVAGAPAPQAPAPAEATLLRPMAPPTYEPSGREGMDIFAKQPWELTREEFDQVRPPVEGYLYHGSGRNDLPSRMDFYMNNSAWGEGPGFYTTPEYTTAMGYARGATTRRSQRGQGRINYIRGEAKNPLDMDAPVDWAVWDALADIGPYNEIDRFVQTADNDGLPARRPVETNADAYKSFLQDLDRGPHGQIHNYDFDGDVQRRLAEMGYDALLYRGPRSGKPNFIFLDPGRGSEGLPAQPVSPAEVWAEQVGQALQRGEAVPERVRRQYESVVGSRGVEAPVEAPEVAPAAPQAAPEVAGGGEVPETAPEAPTASEAPVYVQTDRQMLDELLRKRDNARARRRKAQARLAKLKADRERRGAQGSTRMARASAERTEAEYERRKDRAFGEETSLTKLIEDLQRRVASYEKSVEAPAPTARDLTGQHKTRTWPHMYVHNKMGWWKDAAWQIGNALPEGAEFAMLPEEELPVYTLAALVTSEPLPADFAFDLGLKEMDVPPEYPDEYEEAPVEAPAALPAPGERVVMREARTGREEVGQVVADPESGQPLLATASDGTPVASFEREDGTTTWVPWVADPAIVSFEQAPQEAPAPVEAPSAREQLGIPDAPPVLADDAARAAVSRNIRTLNAALDHVLPQLARMVETHDPASASAISATQAIRLATTARNDAQAQADAPTDALEEIVAEISDARDARDRSDAEDAVAEVLSVAQVLSEQLQAALVEQGVLEAEAQAAGRRASAGYLLLHEATLREAQRWPDAMEGLASLQEGMTPQTLDDLQAREALKQAALREALLTLGEEPAMPELERFALEAPGPEATSREQAHAMLDEGEVLPGEPPIITVARSAVEQVGGEFTPELADIARQAELQRLEVEATRLQREIETYTEGYAAYDDALQQQFELELAQNMEDQRRSRAEADAKQDVEQLQEAARTLKPYLLKYPDVRTELKPTLSMLETETLGMLTAIHHRLLGIYERPRGERALSTEERWLLSYLGAAQQVNASPRDQLRIVLGEAVAEAVIQQGAIRPDGTLDYDKLPRTERRIFEAAAERREFYDDIAHGRKGLPSFQQLSERLYDYRRYGEDVGEPPARPEPIENYLPQFTIHAQGPEDLEWLRDVFTLEWMRGRQEPAVRNRYEALGLLENESQGLREPRREDIVRKRVYSTITAKRAHMQEIATELGVDPGVVEIDPLIQDTVYLHQFGALRTAVGVYEWIHEYGDEQMDVEMDPALGPEVAQAMLDRGWGPPRPFGLALPGTANFLLPPPVQGALNGIIARGTLTPIFDQVITRKIMPPIRKALWSLSMLPLQTLTFLGTQFVELFANVAASGAANPARPKALLEGYALANRVLARQIMGIAETCHPTTWAAEMKLVHARTQENLWAALMKRYELTPDDIQILQDGLKRHNIVEGSVGAQAHEHLERMLSALNLHAKEIQAISHGIMSMVFGIDTFARTWSICSLVAQGYTMDEAGKMTRESSANYDLKTPIYTVASSWAFYSTWLMQRAEQAASLTYKRPGVLYLFAELDDDKERFLGFSAGWQPLVEAGLWWGIDDPTVMPIKRSHPLVGEIEGFLAGTEVLEEWDGYQLFYAPLRLPLLDIMGTGRALSNRPLATLMEMAVPAVRGLAAAETGRGKASSLMREMPGVGPWVRAADRFPEEVLPRLTASVGPAQLALADPPEEFWASVVDAGETPRAAQAKPARWKKVQRQLDMGVPRSQTEPGRYEVEKMQFLYLLEKAKRRTGVPLYAGGVPDAVNLLTPEGIERVIEAIDAGEWIASKPSETPQQFRKRLEEELAQRRPEEAGKAPVGPMTPDEQRGGIAATVSRMLRPVTMEGVAP